MSHSTMMKKLFPIIILLTITAAVSIFIFHSEKSTCEKGEKEKESPDEPYEAFMIQRTYPNHTFDVNAYRTALRSAVEKRYNQRSMASLNWTLEGPGNIGGRFNCLAVNQLDSNVMYAGSANGGVWKTNDHTLNWFPVFDSIPFQAIGAITINPEDTNEIWVGTGDLNISGNLYQGGGVYKSTDAGHSWSYVGLADTYIVSAIVFNPVNPSEVLISTMGNVFSKDNNRGIYRTTNGGVSFTQTKFVNDSTGVIDMIQDPVNTQIVYASSFCRQRTFSTSLTTGTEVYVYKSSDFGQTWNILAGGLPNGQLHERVGLTLCKSNPSIIYALYSTSDLTNPQLYKSNDGGLNWTLIIFNQFDANSYGSYGWYFGKIYCDPVDPDKLYIPAIDLLFSTDGGTTWNLRTPPWNLYEVHGDGHHLYFDSSDEFIYCTDGGLYRTRDGGVNWTDIENIPNNQCYTVTENSNNPGMYATGVQDNGTCFGNSFLMNSYTRIYGGDGFKVIYAPGSPLVYSESQNGNIVYDDLFPNNFIGIDRDFSQIYNWSTPYFLSSSGTDTMYFAGERVMRIDAAPYGTFSNISPILHDLSSPYLVSNISTLNQSKINSSVFYAGTADGKVWNSLDNGVNWNDVTPFQSVSYYVTRVMPSPNHVTNAYVTRSGYRYNDNTPLIFKTTNDGNSWSDISGDLPLLAVNDIEIYPGNDSVIFIANDAGVYVTVNAGNHWQRVGDNLPYVAVNDIQFNYNAGKLLAGTFGRSMYSVDITSFVSGISKIEIKPEVSVYPNPSTAFLFINSNKTIEEISIFDTNGAFVLRSVSRTLDVSSLSEGSYFIKILINGKLIVKRFVKV